MGDVPGPDRLVSSETHEEYKLFFIIHFSGNSFSSPRHRQIVINQVRHSFSLFPLSLGPKLQKQHLSSACEAPDRIRETAGREGGTGGGGGEEMRRGEEKWTSALPVWLLVLVSQGRV